MLRIGTAQKNTTRNSRFNSVASVQALRIQGSQVLRDADAAADSAASTTLRSSKAADTSADSTSGAVQHRHKPLTPYPRRVLEPTRVCMAYMMPPCLDAARSKECFAVEEALAAWGLTARCCRTSASIAQLPARSCDDLATYVLNASAHVATLKPRNAEAQRRRTARGRRRVERPGLLLNHPGTCFSMFALSSLEALGTSSMPRLM